MKLFHQHQYKVIEAAEISVYKYEANGHPDRYDTKVGRMCMKCGKTVVKRHRDIRMKSNDVRDMATANGWIIENNVFEEVQS